MNEKTCKSCCQRFLFEECAAECPLVKDYSAARGLLFAPAAIKFKTEGGETYAGVKS